MLTYPWYSVAGARVVENLFRPFNWVLRLLSLRQKTVNTAPVIVILEPFQLGDVLSQATMFDPILAANPATRIVLWCHESVGHTFLDDSRVFRIETAPFIWSRHYTYWGKVTALPAIERSIRNVRGMRPDFGIDSRGDIRSQVLLGLAGCRRRVGFTRYLASNLTLRGSLLTDAIAPPPNTYRFDLNLLLLKPLLGYVPRLELQRLPSPEAGCRRTLIVVHATARWEYRRWPLERWAEVFDPLLGDSSLHLVLVCAIGESKQMQPLVEMLGNRLECRETTYQELRGLIAEATLFVGLDSGPANLASLLGIRSVVLFGPGDVNLWGSRIEGSVSLHHTDGYACHPCLQKKCSRPDSPCMQMISSREVLVAIRDRLP